MSWAAHNPEKYDEICRNGVRRNLDRKMGAFGFDKETLLTEDQLMAVVETLESEFPKAYSELLSESNSDVCNAEADYFSHRYSR